MIGLSHYLIISAIIFSIGLIGVLRRRNLLMLFFATEVMLNAVNIAFAAISHYYNDLTGQMFAFFIIQSKLTCPAVATCFGLTEDINRRIRPVDAMLRCLFF